MAIFPVDTTFIEVIPLIITLAVFISLLFIKAIMHPKAAAWAIFAFFALLGFIVDWRMAFACAVIFGGLNTVIPHLNRPMTHEMIMAEYKKHEGEGGWAYGFLAGASFFFMYGLLSHLLQIGPMWNMILSE